MAEMITDDRLKLLRVGVEKGATFTASAVGELLDEIERLKEARVEETRERFLSWRGVQDPCDRCRGSGVRAYGNTSTWRHGIGGQAFTLDVCEVCWGTGDRLRKGMDLRKLTGEPMPEELES